MRLASVVAVIVGGVGCHRAESPSVQASAPVEPAGSSAVPAAPTPPSPDAKVEPAVTLPLTLDWKITTTADALVVDYTVANAGATAAYVVDDMLTYTQGKLARMPGGVIVRQGSSPDTASLFLGNLNLPTHDSRLYPSPGARRIEPGASLTGHLSTPLPLAARHNYHPAKLPALTAPPTRVVLQIQALAELGQEGKDWKNETLADGSTVQSPFLRVLNERGALLEGSPLPL